MDLESDMAGAGCRRHPGSHPGQGISLAPLTTFGIAGVEANDAGAASGAVNVAHQLGSAVGLAILVAISASAVGGTEPDLARQVGVAFMGATVMLVLALVLIVVFIVRPAREPETRPA